MRISEIESRNYGSNFVSDADTRSYQLLVKIRGTKNLSQTEVDDMMRALELCEHELLLAVIDNTEETSIVSARIQKCRQLLGIHRKETE